LRYNQLKPLEKRLAEVESRLETLMMENEELHSKLADSLIYEVGQKDRLIATMKQQRDLKKAEQGLMKEWDQLTISIEQIQKH
jgi:regulator of replication initiation timing